MNLAMDSAGRGRGWQSLPRTLHELLVVPTHAASVKDTLVTAHCHAAPAQLTRAYQGDHRRHVLTPTTTRAAAPSLDKSFHISSVLKITRFDLLRLFR